MKDTLRDKIAEIVDYCSESYYPEHEYGNTWADRNKEYLAEAVDQILSLIEEEKINIQIRVLENILESDSWDNPLLLRSLIKGNLATLNSKEQK